MFLFHLTHVCKEGGLEWPCNCYLVPEAVARCDTAFPCFTPIASSSMAERPAQEMARNIGAPFLVSYHTRKKWWGISMFVVFKRPFARVSISGLSRGRIEACPTSRFCSPRIPRYCPCKANGPDNHVEQGVGV